MPTAKALLAAVLATPDDDSSRRAYAGWLTQRGDPRGKFIATQLALAQGDLPPLERRALRARERALLAAHGAKWCKPFAPPDVTFRRGFVEQILCTGEELSDIERILAREPVRSLSLHGYFPYEEHLFLSRLRSLDLSSNVNGVDGISALASLPHLTSLEHLDLSASHLHGACDWVQQLTGSPYLGRLTSIELGFNDVLPAGASALACSDLLSRLTRLGLPYSLLGDEGAAALAASTRVDRLGALDLRGNRIGPRGAKALARAPWLGRLSRLDLRDNDIDDETAAALRARLPSVLLGEAAAASDETIEVWRLIEQAWARAAPELAATRARLLTRDPEAPPPRLIRIFKALQKVTRVLQFFVEQLEQPARLALDETLRGLWEDLDRGDLWDTIQGSDDGFLYGRCFIVAMGRRYYQAVSARPELGIPEAECQDMLSVVEWACEARGEAYL